MSVTPPKGEIIYRWEPPDTSFITYIGHITGDHMRKLVEVSSPFSAGKKYILLLVDLSRLDHVSREAREISKAQSRKGPAAQGGPTPLRGIATFGASFHFRAIANIGMRAYNLLTGQTDNPTRFFDTEAAARAWLAERRNELKAQGLVPGE
jgi:hypothetical protein